MLREFRMPDAGEGLTEAEVLAWRVAVGDVVTVNQVLVEVETAKAVVELPSPYAGTVVELLAQPGDVVPVGEPVIRIEEGAVPEGVPAETGPAETGPAETGPAETGLPEVAQPSPEAPGAERPDRDQPLSAPAPELPGPTAARQQQPGTASQPHQAVLVGYGVTEAPPPRRRPRTTPHGVAHVEPGPPGEPARPVRYGGLEQARAVERRLGETGVLAKPPVRKLARDLGIDLAGVAPTGPGGSVTHEDVMRATAAAADSELVPLSHVARMMGRAMTESAFRAPHATEWVDVDVTAMSGLIRTARSRADFADLPLTPLTFAALGLVRAARAHPTVNASLDASAENLVLHRSVHLGIAVDSPRGLIVPRIKDAQNLDLRGMASALRRLIETARAGRSRPEDLRGSTLTITNVGAFGMDSGTPILNPGEVVILAVGRVLARPWVVDSAVHVRDVVTLALSFDHRVVDGALGARVLREVADFMADPATALALG